MQNFIPSTCPSLFPRAIVFVVDSVAFQREVKDVAEFLYQVLVDSTVLRNAPALLIACNKQGTLGWAWPGLQGFVPRLLDLGVGIAAKGRLEFRFKLWLLSRSV